MISELEKIIEGFDTLLHSRRTAGVYCWSVNGHDFYVGKSGDVLARSYDHMMEIVQSPKYWADALSLGLPVKVRVIEDLTDSVGIDLKERELYWIKMLHPVSQRCDGTDHILPIKMRRDVGYVG